MKLSIAEEFKLKPIPKSRQTVIKRAKVRKDKNVKKHEKRKNNS